MTFSFELLSCLVLFNSYILFPKYYSPGGMDVHEDGYDEQLVLSDYISLSVHRFVLEEKPVGSSQKEYIPTRGIFSWSNI